jgi:VCBS repeat-containing protein
MAMSVPAYDHIVVAMMENHDYSEIIGNSQAPYINGLAAGGALLSNYTAITHPSEPNYFALYAGSTFGVTDDNAHSEPDPTLATILQGAGKTFTGYIEPASPAKHNPWESFPEGFTVERDFSAFPTSNNFASLPSVSFVVPDQNDDMHDGTIQQGDTWLQTNIDSYAQWANTHNSLLIVVWDEGDVSPNNQVASIFYGAHVLPGSYDTAYNHYNLLSTILAAFNLTGPNNAATESAIQVFQSSPPPAPPRAPVISSFSPNTGGVDTTSSIVLNGTAEASSTVTVYDGTSNLGTASVNASGNWSFTENNAANDVHTFTATETDANGTSVASSPFAVTVNVLPPADTPPTVAVSDKTATHGQVLAASSLFSASDADGDTLTQFDFWDTGTGGGHFVLNGVAQGTNQSIVVSASQLAQLSYQSGSGADTLWVRANDGTQWSSWSSSFTVTAPVDTGPVVTPTNFSISSFANQSFAASSLFTYSDPFGSPATQYDVWDTGDGGGHFALNGIPLPANQDNIVSAAQLGQLTYQVGTGTDTLWVKANDGTAWGDWSKSFTISDPPAVEAGKTITLGSAYAGAANFLSDTGTLKLEDPSSFAGTVAGLHGQDAVDLADIAFGVNTTLGYSANSGNTGDTLTVSDGTHATRLALLGQYAASSFVMASDGHGGTLISDPAPSQQSLLTLPHA